MGRRDLAGLRRTHGITDETVHKGVQQVAGGGYPRMLVGC